MVKDLGILIGGIFVGAVAAEVVRKKCPDILDKLYAGAREISTQAQEAFKKGYESATRPQQAAKARA